MFIKPKVLIETAGLEFFEFNNEGQNISLFFLTVLIILNKKVCIPFYSKT